MSEKPHISRREYIQWPPAEPYENTETLVVTSAGGRFVDIRARIYDPTIAPMMPKGINPSEALEWAFAGVASNDIEHDRLGKPIFKCSWRHLVDSRFLRPDKFKDEGEMIPLSKGRTLEKGKMVNPLYPTAGEQKYEEGWVDVPAVSQRKDGRLETAVLQMMEGEGDVRGMVVRVGQACQGIVRVKEDYSCERWLWTKEEGWKRTFKDGGLWMPTNLAMELAKLKVDDVVTNGDLPWKVIELGMTE